MCGRNFALIKNSLEEIDQSNAQWSYQEETWAEPRKLEHGYGGSPSWQNLAEEPTGFTPPSMRSVESHRLMTAKMSKNNGRMYRQRYYLMPDGDEPEIRRVGVPYHVLHRLQKLQATYKRRLGDDTEPSRAD